MLHTLTEDLASFLSEVTQGDLRCPVPCSTRDVGDLYLHLVDQNISVATAIAGEAIPRGQGVGPMDRASLDASMDYYYGGAGLEVGYRRTARLMENAFTSVTDMSRLCRVQGFRGEVDVATLYEEQIRNAVIHTWDIAQALGLPYQPAPDVTQRVLRTIVLRTTQTPPTATPAGTDTEPEVVDDAGAFACVLTLSRRVR
ncbi:maleylpyruvate isomerase family mycothiol-dependent enzyme [Nocardia transvalensis]|uniref:maleylpyruvate isomerase family mycothiol-dependent enzyme n=1 Tax=Nocardia transvalensis TaxID=37333 RepID=UPI001893DC98|nr:maleylpyruvate isomerase family mycothiol-dependent enzyme [Nocardia transvalensis]